MITFTKGNIFDAKVEAIVNPVNCVGVMGKGLALQFKNRYPDMYEAYKVKCKNKEITVGQMYLYYSNEYSGYVINFPTKDHWKNPSKMEYIEEGLVSLVYWINELGIKSIAIPKLGCGCGGLNWYTVKELIAIKLSNEIPDVNVIIYE